MKNITNKHLLPKILLALFVLSGMAVFAAQNETVSRALNLARPEVKVQISGSVRRDNQMVSLEKAEAVKSGETLDWSITSTNEGNADAQKYRVVGQIPQGTTFVAGSAKGDEAPQISYSIDGGKTFAAQPLVDEKQPDGSVKKVPAPVSSYTQLRFDWAKSLPSNAKLAAAYRVRVK
ncbi:MAG: hypothetical protein M3033_15005 [Acidobacteriota bacterium]|nr:hypothetical protein [Acidobacteriota bacterium]